jgi:hypothetical protein
MIPKILTPLLEDPRNKLLKAKKLPSFHHLLVLLDFLHLAKPRHPVSKVKLELRTLSQSSAQFKINTPSKTSLT